MDSEETRIEEKEPASRSPLSVEGIDDEEILFLASVVVINCGGTINMGKGPAKGPAGVVEAKLENIRREVARLGIMLRSEKIFERPPDSSNIGEVEWVRIIGKLKGIIDKKMSICQRLSAKGIKIERGGIVVTHGTDTLQATALIVALEFSIRALGVPVVFTASHSPIEVAGSDGLSNLRKAIFIAKERFNAGVNSLPASVYVLIGQEVHLAARLTKVRTMPDSDGRYFFSFPEPIARITGERLSLRVDEANLRTILPEAPVNFFPHNQLRCPLGIVEHLYVDKFASVVGLEDVKLRLRFYESEPTLDQKRCALVVQGDFSANPNLLGIARIFSEISVNSPIFMGSRKAFEKIRGLLGGGGVFLLPKSMTHTKAQTKLRWLLSFSGIEAHVDDLLRVNFAGEIFDAKELPEWINYETFPERKNGTEVVVVYPDLHARVVEDAVKRLHGSGHPGPRLFLFGFGDGHIPAVNLSIKEIVGKFVDHETLGSVSFKDDEVSVDDVADGLARYLSKYSTPQLKDYLALRYSIDKRTLKRALMKEAALDIRNHEVARLKRTIEGLMMRGKNKGPAKIMFRGKESVSEIMKEFRIIVPDGEVAKSVPNVEAEEWAYGLVDMLKARFAKAIARRIIKDAVMASSRLLCVIGRAVDSGIEVRIRSLAVKSRTNTKNYETGNLLMVLGVNSDDVDGWETRYLQPR